ncbi:MAG: sigma-70 family RNA polymerase sigma factor [Sandaracinaceae bacterium]|nr:sigma-70 family RNA polymerase sigma factor [Sandaracinaceae bacterium]
MKKNTATAARVRSRPRSLRDPFDLYLAGLGDLTPPLDREGEVAAATDIEAAEIECFDLILDAGIALPELAEWYDRLASGEASVLELTHLGSYEGKEGHALLLKRLDDARKAEAWCQKLTQRRAGSGPERRVARDRSWERRAKATRKIALHRERMQAVIERVGRELDRFVDSEGREDPNAAEVVRRAELTLGRRRAVLRRIAVTLGDARRDLDRRRNFLAEANLRLVVMLAKAYRGSGVPFPDLVQEGNLGLMRAVDKFDHRVGTRFSTYATWWIRQSIAREVTRHAETVRVPFGMTEKRKRLRRAERELTQRYGRLPNELELAKEVGMTLEQTRRSLEARTRSISLHAPMGEEGDRSLDEMLADDTAQSADDQVIAREREGAAAKILSVLSPREQFILRRRFGIDGEPDGLTLREIGEQLNLSRERVRQLEALALAKLRAVLDAETASAPRVGSM